MRLDAPDNWIDELPEEPAGQDADFSEDDHDPLWESILDSFAQPDPTNTDFGIPFWMQPIREVRP